jgi:hypothetical protein
MSTQGVPATAGAVRTRSAPAFALKPSVLVPVFIVAAIVGAALPWVIGYAPYGQAAIDQQIDREDRALCTKFGFASGTEGADECKAGLADLRRHHEQLMLY